MGFRYMPRNERSGQPSRIIFLEVAWQKEQQHGDNSLSTDFAIFRCAYALKCRFLNGNEIASSKLETTTATEVWDFINSSLHKKCVTWVIGSNLHQSLTLLNWGERWEQNQFRLHEKNGLGGGGERSKEGKSKPWKGLAVFENKPWMVLVNSDGGRINFVDVANYFPQSVEELYGLSGNEPVKKWPLYPDDKIELLRLQISCETYRTHLFSLMQRWKSEDLGNWKLTIPSMAMSCFRHRFMRHSIMTPDKNEDQELERSCYFGGESKIWRYGVADGPVHCLDVRNMYGYVMGEFAFPFAPGPNVPEPSIDVLKLLCKNYAVFANVAIDNSDGTYPERRNGEVVYNTGMIEANLCGPELMRALYAGHISTIFHVKTYQTAPIFMDYVVYWWKKRKAFMANGDFINANICKTMLNALYGKFGQLSRRWEVWPEFGYAAKPWKHEIVMMDNRPVHIRSVGYEVQRLTDKPEPGQYTFFAIAALVTSYAREFMRHLRSLCPQRSVLAQHTDCLMVTNEAYAALNRAGWVNHECIGHLKCDGTYSQVDIRGVNDYFLDGERTLAGIPLGAMQVAPDRFTHERLLGPNELASKPPSPEIEIKRERFDVTRKHEFEKMNPDGWIWDSIILAEQSGIAKLRDWQFNPPHSSWAMGK